MAHEHVRLDSVMEAMADSQPKYYDALHPPTAVPNPFEPGNDMVELHSYADVSRILKEPDTYSKQLIPLEYKESVPIEMGHWAQDQPQNRELKKVTVPHFTRQALHERLTGVVDGVVTDCVDGIIESGADTVAFDRTFGRIPRRVMAGYIGLDADDPILESWIPEVNKLATTPERDQQVHDIFDRVINERKKTFDGDEPVDPVTAVIVAERSGHQVLGEAITRDWGRAQLEMLAVASDDTSTMALGNILQGFSEHGAIKELHGRPDLITPAVEEGLRRYNAFPRAWGRTKTEVRVGLGSEALTLPRGTVVNGMINAANFDPRVFTDPYTLQLDRSPNAHLSLADQSWRACTGRHLVRYMLQRTVSEISQRLPELQWDGNNTPREHGFVRTIKPGSLRFVIERS